MILGACWWGYGAPGCFIWAEVESSGRICVLGDYKFQRMTESEVAAEVLKRSIQRFEIERPETTYAPPAIFPRYTGALEMDDRPGVIEAETPSQVFARCGLPMVPSGSVEAHGWQRLRDYLRDAPDGAPWLVFDESCSAVQRTLPSLTEDEKNPDKVVGETYAAHAIRLLLSARPHPVALAEIKQPPKFGTLAWLKSREKKPGRRIMELR